MIILQDRDIEIMKLCYHHQFVVTDQIQSFFEGSYKPARRRIGQLIEAEYLYEDPTVSWGKKSLIRLTDKGREVASVGEPHPVEVVKQINSATVAHDALVTSVRQKLCSIWLARFIPEGVFRHFKEEVIPDGMFLFDKGHAIALEVETSDKGESRTVEQLSRWVVYPRVVFVLYVLDDATARSRFNEYVKKAPAEQPIGTVLWGDLAQGKPLVQTQRGPVDLFRPTLFK